MNWQWRSATVLLWVVAVLGLFFRVRQFLFTRPLALDEAYLAINVVERPMGVLLSLPLEFKQSAPVGFLFASKLSTALFGDSEQALRLVPLLAGVLTLAVAMQLGREVLASTPARLCFLGLVAFAPVLVYYSTEFKHYAVDVLICLSILWVGLKQNEWKHGRLILMVVGCVGLWLSYPSLFVLAAVGLVLAGEAIPARATRPLWPLLLVGLAWMVSLGASFLFSTQAHFSDPGLRAYWRQGYAPVLIDSVQELRWYWDSALGAIYLALGERGFVDPLARLEWFSPINVLLLVVTVAGLILIYRRSRRLFGFMVLTLVFALMAAGLKLYPFRSRLILYLTPLVYLAASSLVDWFAAARLTLLRAMAWVGALALMASLLLPTIQIAQSPYNNSDVPGALAYIRDRRQPGDLLALSSWSEPTYRFYSGQLGIQEMRQIATISRENSPELFLQGICDSQAFDRTWLLFSHRFDERIEFLDYLESKVNLLESWQGYDAGAYLYDFATIKELHCVEPKS